MRINLRAAFHVMPVCMLEYMCAACVFWVCVCASLCVIEWVRTIHVHVLDEVSVLIFNVES